MWSSLIIAASLGLYAHEVNVYSADLSPMYVHFPETLPWYKYHVPSATDPAYRQFPRNREVT